MAGSPATSATSTKIRGSAGIAGWKNAKQRRSGGARRARSASQPLIACTASYSMIFSSTSAGVLQSISRSTRKPRLNQERKRWRKSTSTRARSASERACSSSRARSRTSASVAPGTRFNRRSSSWRRGSTLAVSRSSVAAAGPTA